MKSAVTKTELNAFRSFNRFYTRQIGLLNRGLLQTPFSLTQARVLFELANNTDIAASDLMSKLNLDRGYLSRILASFEQQGLSKKIRSKTDSRRHGLRLTAKGKKTFATLDSRSNEEARTILEAMPPERRMQFLDAMKTIQETLEPGALPSVPCRLRSFLPGDAGWIIYRHGILYEQEYGFDETFEALVAEILAKFLKEHDAEKERIWIAEIQGEIVGSVMIVNAGDGIAQLRLLLVEPKARGRGIGKLLVDECISFARSKRYRKMKLWTQSNLDAARSLYVKTGFQIVEEKSHRSFGQDLVAEVWQLDLATEQ